MPSDADDLLVRRASRRIAVQAACLVAAAMMLLVGLILFVVVRGQHRATDSLLRAAAARADDVGDPPSGAWVVLADAARVAASPGLPADVRASLALLRDQASARPVLHTLSEDDGGAYRVVTVRRSGQTVQVLLDLQPQQQELARLYWAMGVAAALSLLAAAGLGVFLGRRAVRPLAHALALQRSFVADASHELRTPLTLLSTRVQVLDRELRSGGAPAAVLADSTGVLADVSRLGEVVEDLLVAADPRQEGAFDRVNLGSLVAKVLASAEAHARARDVALSLSLGGEPLTVQGSEAALRRAVLAVVDNAVDHAPRGSQVDLRVSRTRRHVILSVRNDGPGIAPEVAEGLFRRFASGGQRAGRAHYGLGLALSLDVANRHGGTLRPVPVTSGTMFALTLPAAR